MMSEELSFGDGSSRWFQAFSRASVTVILTHHRRTKELSTMTSRAVLLFVALALFALSAEVSTAMHARKSKKRIGTRRSNGSDASSCVLRRFI